MPEPLLSLNLALALNSQRRPANCPLRLRQCEKVSPASTRSLLAPEWIDERLHGKLNGRERRVAERDIDSQRLARPQFAQNGLGWSPVGPRESERANSGVGVL